MSLVLLTPRPRDPVVLYKPIRYHQLAERLALVEPIADYFAQIGKKTADMIDDVAARSGRGKKQASRMIDEWIEVQANGLPSVVPHLTDAFLALIAENNGNAAKAIRAAYSAEDAKRLRSSIYRWLDEIHIDLLMALKGGVKSWERYLEIGIYEPQHRNDLWFMDEMHFPIACREGYDLWLISVFEAFSRLCLAAQVTVGAADDDIAAAVLARACAGGTWEGVEYGGSADALGLDNAKINTSDVMREAMRVAGIPPKFARPYTGPDKAPQERWHRTIQEGWLTAFPAYLKGPDKRVYVETGELDREGKPKYRRQERPLHLPADPELLPSAEDVTQGLYAAIYDYNTNWVVSTTGMTPLARFASDPRPMRRPGIAAFWDFALPAGEPGKPFYVGERRGIRVDGEWRKPADMSLNKRRLVPRLLPGMDPRYLVGDYDKPGFLAEVRPTADETEEQRQARLARNHAFTERMRQITTIGQANVLARVNPGTPAYVSEKRAEQLATSNPATLASPEAALDVPEPDAAA